MLRIAIPALAAAVIAALAAGPAEAQCPSDPVRASFSIWPAGTLINNRPVSARHACGRMLQCIGAHNKTGERRCQWL